MSGVDFTSNEMDLLNKGLKYCPSLPVRRSDVISLMASVECVIDNDNSLNECSVKLNKFVQGKKVEEERNQELMLLKSISNKIKDNDLIFSKCDKGQSLIILDKETYNYKAFSLLRENNCVPIDDPTAAYDRKVRAALDNTEYLFTDREVQGLIQINPSAPRLYCLPKIHKDSVPLRPIYSFHGAPTEKLMKRLVSEFNKLSNFKSKYAIKNSLHLIDLLKDKELPESCLLVSFDIVNLFTSVPPKDVVKLMEGRLMENNCNPFLKDELVRLYNMCFEQNYFKFQNVIYRQEDGLAMGSPGSSIGAELYVDHVERSGIMSPCNPFFKHILFWSHYVDDTFAIFKGNREDLKAFFKYLNSIDDHLKFTMEVEEANKINFLDITIEKQERHLGFSIFRKPTHSDVAINSTSRHHYGHKMSVFHHLAYRLYNVPLNKVNFDKEKDYIYHVAQANGYDRSVIDRILKKVERRSLTKCTVQVNKESNVNNWVSLPFLGEISYQVARVMNREGVRVSFKSSNSLKDILCNGKDSLAWGDSSGVYRLECGSCSASYVGRTLRKLRTRCKEHLKRKDSKFYEHLINDGHLNGPHRVCLLHKENGVAKLNKLEEIEIKLDMVRNKSNLNSKGEGAGCRVVGDKPDVFLISNQSLKSRLLSSLL